MRFFQYLWDLMKWPCVWCGKKINWGDFPEGTTRPWASRCLECQKKPFLLPVGHSGISPKHVECPCGVLNKRGTPCRCPFGD